MLCQYDAYTEQNREGRDTWGQLPIPVPFAAVTATVPHAPHVTFGETTSRTIPEVDLAMRQSSSPEVMDTEAIVAADQEAELEEMSDYVLAVVGTFTSLQSIPFTD